MAIAEASASSASCCFTALIAGIFGGNPRRNSRATSEQARVSLAHCAQHVLSFVFGHIPFYVSS